MDYRNPAACLDLLRRLHPTNVDETHSILSRVISTLQSYPPAANQHLEVLESARPIVAFVQGEISKRYAAHPLPPDSSENETLLKAVGLWRDMARSYTRVILADAIDSGLTENMPQLFQRQLHYNAQLLLEYFRARRSLPAGAWTDLHAAYSAAERNNVARTRVADSLNEVWKAQSAAEAYVALLLVDLSNPYGRTQRELTWITRWAQRFAPYCTLDTSSAESKPLRYGLDLSADHGVRPLGLLTASESLRYFDGNRLASHIQGVLQQLKRGVSPASLGLGDDCAAREAGKLLLSLYRPWGLASAGRRFARRGARGSLEMVADWDAIAFHINGRAFTAPTARTVSTIRNDMALLTFGERANEVTPDRAKIRENAERLGYASSHWEVIDQSVGGFRIRCRPEGLRLDHHQLVGIRPPDGEQILLARISWLMFRADGLLEAGLYTMPGIPSVAAARQISAHANARSPYLPCFLLPAVPALKSEASIVTPGGWYQAERVLEIHADRPYQARMTAQVASGTNYDQINVTPLQRAR